MAVNGLKFVAFLVFGLSVASSWPSYPDVIQGKGKAFENVTFPLPTFLDNVSFIEEIKFDLIALNPNLTTDEKDSQLEAWARNQSAAVYDAYTEYHANLTESINEIIEIFNNRIANQSKEVQDLYENIKDIRLNTNITAIQQCEEIQEAVKNSSAITFTKLRIAVPIITGDCSVGGYRGVIGSIGSGVSSVTKSIGSFFGNLANKFKF
uniref:ANIS5_cation-bd domain-containing protein n=1 Tax=Panagrellus redivivus TaxID=6233 RepID=A0A7E4VX20_PANRE